jgi:tryptophan synthase alpha chain
MGHVIADYPSKAAVRTMIGVMAAAGVEVIEIQIPFSEPMADGPLFLAANHKALAQGVDYGAAMALMREMATAYPEVHGVFMSYLNIPFKRGWEGFAADAATAGAHGVIVPDLPGDLAGPLEAALGARGLANVRLIAPNCPDARLDALLSGKQSLIYAVARAGVTGAKTDFGQGLGGFLGRIRARSEAPIAVGFGVRGKDDVKALRDLGGLADLAVVGTASLKAWMAGGEEAYRAFWGEVAAAARR